MSHMLMSTLVCFLHPTPLIMRFWQSRGEKKVMQAHNRSTTDLLQKIGKWSQRMGVTQTYQGWGSAKLRSSFPTSQHDPQQEDKACADVHEISSPLVQEGQLLCVAGTMAVDSQEPVVHTHTQQDPMYAFIYSVMSIVSPLAAAGGKGPPLVSNA